MNLTLWIGLCVSFLLGDLFCGVYGVGRLKCFQWRGYVWEAVQAVRAVLVVQEKRLYRLYPCLREI